MSKIKYILFDLDGTLTDPKEGITKSFQYALEKCGIIEENLDTLEKVIGPPLKGSFIAYYGMEEEMAKKAVTYYRERFETIGLYENIIYKGMKELLHELNEKNILLAVASSKPTVFIERICKHFEIDGYFHHMIGSFLDGRRVEKEEVVEEAIRQFESIKKEEVIMVGDRKFDVEGAHKKGISVIGVTFGYGGYEELKEAGADKIVNSVEELKETIFCMIQ